MNRFYKVTITKQPIGTAIAHKEPPVQGNVIIKVTDTTTAGDYKLIVVDCQEEQHQANLSLPGVAALSEDEAAELAAKYQPQRTVTRMQPLPTKQEKVTVPEFDLKKFLQPETQKKKKR